MAKRPKGVVLGKGKYRATQTGNAVLLIATGIHPTTGFREFFEAHDLTSKMPEFAFFFITPTGIVNPVITPFQHHEHFEVSEKIDFVLIEDADGEHRIRVAQVAVDANDAPETRVMKAKLAMAAAPMTAAQCRGCVRGVVAQWANNNAFSDDQTLGDILTTGPCSVGAIAELAQAIAAGCSDPPDSIACEMTVQQLLEQTC